MADVSKTGSTGNVPVQGFESSSPVSPYDQAKFETNDNKLRDNFLDYLNQKLIAFEKKVHEGQFFDTASEISKNSLYSEPDQFKP